MCWVICVSMKGKSDSEKTGTWIIRRIPADLMRRTRMEARDALAQPGHMPGAVEPAV